MSRSAQGQVSRQRSASNRSARDRIAGGHDYVPSNTIPTVVRHFDPCAATAGLFLYAQGNSIVCCQHDTLTIERRFAGHADEVQLLAVDNQSERSAGRLAVSYDASQDAIVWDIMDGRQVARFASFSNLTSVAWMRNGAVAFGNDSGTIILFDPESSEHLSFRTIDQIAVTALAPAADCRTFAIGYQNGSLLICNLQPRFTILHNLTTSRGPSPIVGLSWHASSSRQKSDMLSVQTNDGDLRVWSVAKAHHSSDPAKVVRILKKNEIYAPGANWMGWSKNGRIIQFSDSETLSWDVRTKHVTYDSIPTLEHVRGLAVYGPGAILFTLGLNNTVQQFDLNSPAVIVANVQHPANLLPPSPPISIEEQEQAAAAEAAAAAAAATPSVTDFATDSAASTSESEISIHLDGGVSESDDDHMSPFARIGNAIAREQEEIVRPQSAASSQSHISSKSGQSSRTPGAHYPGSIQSLGMSENTYMSMGSSLKSAAITNNLQQPFRQSTAYSVSTSSSFASTNQSRGRPSRLRNEVPRSPEDARVHDLFKFTRSRLSDVPYRLPPPLNDGRLTNDDLRRQMLNTIFGWTREMQDLVRDELSRHPAGSPNRILLAKWLGDIDSDIMTASSESMTSSDWMLLALSGIGGQANQHGLGRAYTQRLLESGDVHAAATIMIGMGDHNDAIEIYVSHHKYMEALIVACLFYPSVWERQSHLVKKWGEWAIKNGQRELAIRCFACTGKESTEPWTSPSAAQISFPSIQGVLPEALSPPLSPPSGMKRGPQRNMTKSSLRLITNFADDKNSPRSFYARNDNDGATPIAAGVTPIVDSAITPGMKNNNNEITTAFINPSQRSQFNTPSSARPGMGGFGRPRLPSIGEAPTDVKLPNTLLKGVSAALDPQPPAAEYRPEHQRSASTRVPSMDDGGIGNDSNNSNYSIGMSLPRASTSSPMYRRKPQPPPSPSPASLAMLMEGRNSRNGPRNRIPVGVDLSLTPPNVSHETQAPPVTSPEPSVASSTNRYRWPTRRRGPGSVASSVTSASSAATGRSQRYRTGDVPNVTKTLDEYINSLEAARLKGRQRGQSQERRPPRASSRHRRPSASTNTSGAPTPTPTMHNREPVPVEERGRAPSRGYASSKTSGKRSPRSPVPMSPEDLINLSTPKMAGTDGKPGNNEAVPLSVRKQMTTEEIVQQMIKSRPGSRASSRGRAPPPPLELNTRGRNKSRTSSAVRSPSSPLPFTKEVVQFYNSEDEDDDYKKALDAKERFRKTASTRGRASSRNPRDQSPGSTRARSQSRRRPTPQAEMAGATSRKERNVGPPPAPSALAVASGIGGQYSGSDAINVKLGQQAGETIKGDLRQMSLDGRANRKAAAARELEERRLSLARYQLGSSVVQPGELPSTAGGPYLQPSALERFELHMPDKFTAPSDLPTRSQSTEPGAKSRGMFASRGPSIGLPATPKAMRLVLDSGTGMPTVPPIPQNYQQSPVGFGPVSPENKSPKREEILLPTTFTPNPSGKSRTATATPATQIAVTPAPEANVAPPTLTLLPSTVYQPPSRGMIPRSMSAPPEKQQFNGGPRRNTGRGPKLIIPQSSGDNVPIQMSTIDSSVDVSAAAGARRPSLDNISLPPPPPPPPMLKELAHLAMPPPPPPAPLPFGSMGPVYGGQTTGTIEMVMDDGQVKPILTTMSPVSSMPSQSMIPPPPPLPPLMPVAMDSGSMSQSRSSHRGRSSVDNTSSSGRYSRTTERMRSASRGPNNISATGSRTDVSYAPYESVHLAGSEPQQVAYAPYESVQQTGLSGMSYVTRSSPPQHQAEQQQQQQNMAQMRFSSQLNTGLHHSEMI